MNKRRFFRSILAAILLTISIGSAAQDITVEELELDLTEIKAKTNPVRDRNDTLCALIIIDITGQVTPESVVIESHMPSVDKKIKPGGEIWLYVPQRTTLLTIKCRGNQPLRNYRIPVEIESGMTYHALVNVAKAAPAQAFNEESAVYAGLGFNVVSIMGPSLAIGISLDHHNVELGGVIGINKSDELFAYSKDNELLAGFTYKALRAYARYGYEVPLTSTISVVPQAGLALNFINGSKVADIVVTDDNYMKSASALSALIGVRLVAALSPHIKLQLTPEYDFGLSKNNNCKKLSQTDNTIKQWTDGLNLNVGVMAFF